jgi:HlyD family secretion protein
MEMRAQYAMLALLGSLLLAACRPEPPQALGTLEWDRITLPATASEPVLEIAVREGDAVRAGDLLVQLDSSRAQARRDAAQGEVQRLRGQLDALLVGARSESREEAAARVQAARALARNAEQQLARTRALVAQQLLPAAQLDQAQASARSARAELDAASAAHNLLRNGSRVEDIAQAQGALDAAEAQMSTAQTDLARLSVHAPRAGRVDSLPYKVGDQPPIGAPLVVLLVGDAPYARVYVPEPARAGLRIGQMVDVAIEGSPQVHAGRLRAIRSEASFTPYFALTGNDAARLSYLAEIQLGADAVELPVGIPLRAQWTVPTKP